MTKVAHRTEAFTESVIREMTRLIHLHHPEDGINLAQGFPDFGAPALLKQAACDAIMSDLNQYAVTWGANDFRAAIAAKTSRFLGMPVDADTQVTVCCGATEAMISTMLGLLNPGDEVIILEPFYENYGPDCILSGAVPRFVSLCPPDWTIDWDALESAFSSKTRAVVLNTPNNPTGKVFTRDELDRIAALCRRWDTLVFSDEIYEHMVYDDAEHISPATLPGMDERTVIINGLSKTYSVTGWRVGYTISPPELSGAIRKVHDFLTVGAAAPLQAAGVCAMQFDARYYVDLREAYERRRDLMLEILRESGFLPFVPRGAYYVMADVSPLGFSSGVECATFLVEEVGVAVVPGSSFFHTPGAGQHLVRFAFPKRESTLERARERLLTVRDRWAAATR